MKCTLICLVVLACLLNTASAETAATARDLHKRYKDAVVWVLAVVEIEASGGGRTMPAREEQLEVLGTVIDAKGLTVVSYSSIDPTLGINNRKVASAQGSISITASLSFKEVKLQLGDGTEIPASILIKDTDLDIAFIQPDLESDEAEGITFSPVLLSDSAEADLLDEVVLLSRQNKFLSRSPSVSLGRISARVNKPRRLYQASLFNQGAPVFTAQGKLLGISVRRMANGRPMMPVVLPAADVLDIAGQAREKAENESKTENEKAP